ncbi:uncharacterized protein LOC132716102 [Ruditapes philippinarum]|uniref:uncharacterized protein LOC132716102 n=1 Tax=Ruditapes philippinarum TaxID=129788 RepID=UPI00295B0F7D|nr:uncharacterized protein LOC132716102 [Ruditapes philippinarum]
MYCTETPKPDCEEWVAYRKKQEDEFRRKQSIIPKPNIQETVKLMANNSVICFEKVVRESTMFFKKIPGFNNLDMEDKIALIKESRQETQIPSLIRSYHTEMKIASPVPGYNFIVEDVMHLMPDKAEDMFECVRVHAQRDIWRTVTDEEEALFKAIVFTDADRCPTLKNRDKVIRLHRHMIACLEHFLETTFKDDAPARKREIDYMLLSCRYFSVSFHNYMKEKLLQIPGHAQNQTLNEVML